MKTDSFLFRFFKKVYAPFILKEWVRPIIVSTPVTLCQPCTSVSRVFTGATPPSCRVLLHVDGFSWTHFIVQNIVVVDYMMTVFFIQRFFHLFV